MVMTIIRAIRHVDDESIPVLDNQFKEQLDHIFEAIYQKANDNETDLEVREQGIYYS